jgi:hypothetical protein
VTPPPVVEAAVCRAISIEGNTTPAELAWLADQASRVPAGGLAIEVGSLFGRSARAICDALPERALLLCVDHWQGTPGDPVGVAGSTRRVPARKLWVSFLAEFADEMHNRVRPRVWPMKFDSEYVAYLLANRRADLIFIDADHSLKAVRADLRLWLPKLKPGGVICGHNYNADNLEVVEAVDERLSVTNPVGSIWAWGVRV